MTFTLYATTAAVFLILDAIMLTLVMKPLFTRHIGPFWPNRSALPRRLSSTSPMSRALCTSSRFPRCATGAPVILPALIIGLMAYGTYEFTSWAVMRDWHWQMVLTDTLWGGTLTALSAWAGVTVTRMIHG
jgi:uncharacterized membrane protein